MMTRGGTVLIRKPCSWDGIDSITGRRCILLDGHDGAHRVDTPLPDSDEWHQPWWKDYREAKVGEVDWTDGGRRAPITSRDDYKRGRIDDHGRPFIDDEQVVVAEYEAFRHAWVTFYDSVACPESNCDGEAGHEGPHHAWTAE